MACEVKYEEEYTLNARGLKLFTCKWLPVDQEPNALVFICHGYALECSSCMQGFGTRLAKAGFAVYGIDYQGHGKSSGLDGFIPCFDDLVSDCGDHFTRVCEKEGNKNKKRYMLGESMGGNVALLLHMKMPNYWDGAILVAPMCKIAEELKPNQVVVGVLNKLSKYKPKWKLIPTQDIIDTAFRDPDKRREIRSNPFCYKGRPRLKTGSVLLKVSLDMEKKLHEVSLPFIIVHGGDDKVTDPSVSQLLYESAASTDKTFKLYQGMWHNLTYGETKDNIDIVLSDIITWLEERTKNENSRLEEKEENRPGEFYPESKNENSRLEEEEENRRGEFYPESKNENSRLDEEKNLPGEIQQESKNENSRLDEEKNLPIEIHQESKIENSRLVEKQNIPSEIHQEVCTEE